MRPRPAPLLTAALLLAGCGGRSGPSATPQDAHVTTLQPFEHDFGIIPHGEAREHEFPVDLSLLPEPYVPMRVHIDCSCGHADLRIRHADGRPPRFCDGGPTVSNLPGPDEQLFLYVKIDTSTKEAIDLPKTASHGFVVLQPVDERNGPRTPIQWPMLLRFGIESPVDVRPFAALDFARVATSQRGEIVTTLRGDERNRDMKFGPVKCSDPSLTVALEPAADHVVLRASLRSADLGPHRALVEVATSRPGYTVPLVATWKIVPDLEATPIAKVIVQAELARAQREDEIGPQFVNVVDHDVSRSPEFAVHAVVAADGSDLSSHFAVTFTPAESDSRTRHMFVRYTGGLTDAVRGSIVLTKGGSDGPQLAVDLVLFPKKTR